MGVEKGYSGRPTIHVSVGSHIVTSQMTNVSWGAQNLQQRVSTSVKNTTLYAQTRIRTVISTVMAVVQKAALQVTFLVRGTHTLLELLNLSYVILLLLVFGIIKLINTVVVIMIIRRNLLESQ